MSDLRNQLESVRATYGALTPEHVVEAARPEDAPLHDRFEWDDTVAAERWRNEQASDLIRSYRVTYARDASGPRSVRGYIAVRPEQSSGRRAYVPVDQVMADPFTRRLVLLELERDLNALREKYGHLQEYAELLSRELAAA